MGRIFISEKPVFFIAKNKTVIRRGPNPNVCLLVWGFIDLREELFVKYTYLSIAFSYLLYFILLKIKIKKLCLFSHLASGESTFGELFGEAAAKYEMLCIGLYRLVKILHKIIFPQGFLHAL